MMIPDQKKRRQTQSINTQHHSSSGLMPSSMLTKLSEKQLLAGEREKTAVVTFAEDAIERRMMPELIGTKAAQEAIKKK